MDQVVEKVVHQAFPDRDIATIAEAPNSELPGNHMARLNFTDESVIFLKIRVDGDATRNRREVASTQYARAQSGIEVPRVVAADSEFTPPYMATAPIGEIPMSNNFDSPSNYRTVAHDIGRTIAGISAADSEDHGWIVDGDETGLDCETGTWSEVLVTVVQQEAEELPYPDRFADVPERVTELFEENNGILDGATPTLVHQDIRPENVFDGDRLGAVDWEWTLVGDSGLGLCWGEYWVGDQVDVSASERDRLRKRLHKGYREYAGSLPTGFEERRPFYRVLTYLATLKTFEFWAPEADEPTGQVADRVRDELNRRIETARCVGGGSTDRSRA
jgi:fructosamine-3-kinase